MCVRVLVLLGRVGRGGLPGAFQCASPFLWPLFLSALLGPLRAGVAPLLFCCSFCWSPASRLFVRSRCFCVFDLAFGCSLVVAAPPLPFGIWRFLSLPLGVPAPLFVFFPLLLCSCALAWFSPSAAPPPPLIPPERSLGWCAALAPPLNRTAAPPPRMISRAGLREGHR